MEGIAIESERLVATGAGVNDVGTQLAIQIGRMDELLLEIRGGWQSEQAAPAFAATMQGYLEQATLLKNALVSHGSSLVTAGHRFAEAEADLAAGMGSR